MYLHISKTLVEKLKNKKLSREKKIRKKFGGNYKKMENLFHAH